MRHPLVLNLLRYRYVLLAVLVLCVSITFLMNAINHTLATSPVLDRSQSAPRSEEIGFTQEVTQPIRYVALLERPLFSRTRRPYVPPQLPPAEEPPAAPEVILSEPQLTIQGIFIRGEIRQALILSAENPSAVWISEGENISGWMLAEIKPNELILLAGTRRRTIELYVEKSQLNVN